MSKTGIDYIDYPEGHWEHGKWVVPKATQPTGTNVVASSGYGYGAKPPSAGSAVPSPYLNPGLGTAGGQGTAFPDRTTIASALPGIQKLLPGGGTYTPVDFTQLAGISGDQFGAVKGLDSNQFGQVKGLGQDYFQSLTDNATKNLRKQFYEGENSLAAQNELMATKRGILGTGIEQGGMNALNQDFGTSLANLTGEIGRLQAEKDYELALKNRDFDYNIAKGNQDLDLSNRNFAYDLARGNKDIDQFNAQNILDTAFKNKQGEFDMKELALRAAGDEASNATDYDIGKFEQNVELEKIMSDLFSSQTDSITDLYGNRDVPEGIRDDFLEELYKRLGMSVPGE